MNSTLYNGYSGIKTHQFGLDSTSNNIANINTNGYRANMPEFKSIFANALNTINPKSSVASDMNYGSNVASNAISNNNGSYKESDEEFSIAYAGKGWFVVGDNENIAFSGGTNKGVYFTRDGGFSRDAQGFVVNSAGYYMLGVDLGKIKDGIFISNTQNDEEMLATGEIKPLQIPQDLHYGPTESTFVNVALNLNANQSELNSYNFFVDNNGNFDSEKLLNTDINALVVDNENINANAYNDGTISITKNGETSQYHFQYGDFRTFGELKNAILQSGLELDFVRDMNGAIDKNLVLELKSNHLDSISVSISGKLFEKLGLKGERDFNNFNIHSFENGKQYSENDLVDFKGVIFRKIQNDGINNPFDETQWEIVDTFGVSDFNENKQYNIDDLVAQDGRIYQKIGEENTNPSEDSANWRVFSEEVALEISDFEPKNYARNSYVFYNNHIYQKISNEDSTNNPSADILHWKMIDSSGFSGNKLNFANYKTTTEIFNDNGDKLVIISKYILSQNTAESQVWSVESGIYTKDGESLIGEIVNHNISFDNAGNVISPPITLQYNDKTITYNIAGSENKSSSNMAYMDSSVLDSTKDGTQKGELTYIGIDNNGIINLSFSNGITERMGRVGVVAFVNDQGLQKVGGNLFEMSSYLIDGQDSLPASGNPLIGWDEKGALRFGQILHKYLETSNVNPADAMTDLIIYQRGYSMNAKAFTTGDDLIKEAINLKR